ncbi:MAG: hypothetical protein KAS32_13795 [Candidatus Peribacteraceae bacterium]|nr:hypothetical protein [Candidatus Peribacteraceae bacterium]
MTHSSRCENAKPESRCRCSCGGRFHGISNQQRLAAMGNNERIMSTEFGGEVEEVLNKLTGESFRCTCSKTHTLNAFIGYPHDGGIAGKDDKRWWVYWHCPSCHYEWSWHKLLRRLKEQQPKGG